MWGLSTLWRMGVGACKRGVGEMGSLQEMPGSQLGKEGRRLPVVIRWTLIQSFVLGMAFLVCGVASRVYLFASPESKSCLESELGWWWGGIWGSAHISQDCNSCFQRCQGPSVAEPLGLGQTPSSPFTSLGSLV